MIEQWLTDKSHSTCLNGWSDRFLCFCGTCNYFGDQLTRGKASLGGGHGQERVASHRSALLFLLVNFWSQFCFSSTCIVNVHWMCIDSALYSNVDFCCLDVWNWWIFNDILASTWWIKRGRSVCFTLHNFIHVAIKSKIELLRSLKEYRALEVF